MLNISEEFKSKEIKESPNQNSISESQASSNNIDNFQGFTYNRTFSMENNENVSVNQIK